jgi:hypothetical protein
MGFFVSILFLWTEEDKKTLSRRQRQQIERCIEGRIFSGDIPPGDMGTQPGDPYNIHIHRHFYQPNHVALMLTRPVVRN